MIVPEHLYRQIVKLMPIPCVDLLIVDQLKRVLLVQRTNEPAKGQWWFPGGRVYFGEKRSDTAIRKLKEECQLHSNKSPVEKSSYDFIFKQLDGSQIHSISTIYEISVDSNSSIILDNQSESYEWNYINKWLNEFNLDSYVKNILLSKNEG